VEDTDRRIVDLLLTDGRMSFTDLAKATGLSTSAVHQRVRRLEDRGVIQGYRAIVDPVAVDRSLTAFLSLTATGGIQPEGAVEALAELPEISACYSVAGRESFIVIVRVATPNALEELLNEIQRRTGMSTRTTVALSTKFDR